MNSHLRVLRVFADGQPHTADYVFVSLPYERFCGRVCKDLVADRCLELVGPGVNYRITETGRRRLARSTPVGGRR